MKGVSVVLLVVGLVCGIQGAFAGRAFYVSQQGNDGWSGSFELPWRTLQKANATLVAGDTVYVRGGEYDAIISPANSGSAGQPIVYTRYGYEAVTLVGESKTKKGVVAIGWNLSTNSQGAPKSYIIVDGFVIRYRYASQLPDAPVFSNRFGYVCIANPQSRYNVIRNCIIAEGGDPFDNYMTGFRQAGVKVTDALDTQIEGNDISGMWIGVWLSGGVPRRNVVRSNNIHDVGSSGIDISDPETGEDGLQGNLIEYNVISNSVNEDGIQFEPNYCGNLTVASNRGTILRNNIIRYVAENAFDLKGAARIVIEGNIVYSNNGDNDGLVDGPDRTGGMGGVIHGGSGVDGIPSATRDVIIRGNVFYDNYGALQLEKGYKVYNNTLVANNRDYTGPNSSWRSNPGPGFTAMLTYGTDSIVIKNNIVVEHAQGEASLNVFDLKHAAVDNNIYSNANGVYFCDAGGALFTHYTLASWQQRMSSAGVGGAEAHSFIATPGFRNASGRPSGDHTQFDFSLSSGSPAIDAGGPLSHTVGAGSGTLVSVEDAGLFCDGFGVTSGDVVQIGTAGTAVVTAVDIAQRTIRIDRSLSWGAGEPINRPFIGSAPDVGAFESTGGSVSFMPAPTPVYPLSSTEDVSGQASLHWQSVPGAVTYRVQVSRTSNFRNLDFDREFIRDTVAWIPQLDRATAYYWRVVAVAPNAQGNWTSPVAFATTGGVPAVPKQEEADHIANGGFESGTSGWSFFTNGTGAISVVPHAGGSAAQVAITTVGNNMQLNQSGIVLQNGVRYLLRFSAMSTTGSDCAISIQKNSAPYNSYGLWSTNIDLTSSWGEYAIEFTAVVPGDSATDGRLLLWFAGSAKAGDQYQIDDVSLKSLALDPAVPDPPTILWPLSGSTGQPLTISLNWTKVASVLSYVVELAYDPLFQDIIDNRMVGSAVTGFENLPEMSMVYARVRSIGSAGAGTFSPTVAFETGLATSVRSLSGVPAAFALSQNYPNPFNPTTRIQYNIPLRGYVSLRVYNALGAQVAVADEGEREAGVHEVTYDGARLASGLYFVRMQSGAFSATRKMVLVR